MPDVKSILFALLAIVAVVFIAVWCRELNRKRDWVWPTPLQTIVGFITDFLDTLGVGSFAVTTTIYRTRKMVADELIPGTMNVGHSLPTIIQAFVYIAIIEIEMKTLVLTIAAAVAGAVSGVGFVTHWPRARIQFGMGVALLIAAGLILARLANILPPGGSAKELTGAYLIAALLGNFLFGAMMMIGVGAYAPIMIMVCLLGMNPLTAFPIMMGSCAFLMPISGMRFIRAGAYNSRASLGLTLGGIPGVFLAAFIVKELNVDIVRWLVVVIVLYTATSLIQASKNKTTLLSGEPA